MFHTQDLPNIFPLKLIYSRIAFYTKYFELTFLARWLTSARLIEWVCEDASVCAMYVKRYLLLQYCTDYNQTW